MIDKNQDVTTLDIYKMLAGEILPSDIHERRANRQRQKTVGKRQRQIESELEKFSTGKLMKMRKQWFCSDTVWRDGNNYLRGDWEKATEAEYDEEQAQRFALSAVLARRPHIPNKIEGHENRRLVAKAHHGPKKRGGRLIKQHGGQMVVGGRVY